MNKQKIAEAYDKYYKLLLVISILFLLAGIGYLYTFSQTHGDIIKKDITLSGGTSVQVNTQTDIKLLEQELSQNFDDFSIRQISNILTGEQIAFVVEIAIPPEEIIPVLETYLGFGLDEKNSSIEFTGSSLSDSFYNQLRFAIALSFIFMAIIVFIIFRIFIPSVAVIFAAFSDIVLTIAVVDYMGMAFSTAGIVALLMLIGYSVDTDILLTTRVLKRRGTSINSRIFNAFKTGITMSLTSLAVVVIGLILTYSVSKTFSQIFTILTIGIIFDIANTWLGNASMIKWYAQKKQLD